MPGQRVTLCLAVTDPPRMAATVRICAALGVCDIQPVISDRVDAADVEQWREHIETTSTANLSTDTSASNTFSQDAPRMLDAIKLLVSEGAHVIILWEDATEPTLVDLIASLNLHRSGSEHIAIVVGPRLGLSRPEVAAAVSLGARTATIGSTVIGNHVAAIAGLMILEHSMRH